MAKTRLGNATFVEHGYGQVEPNHLSARRTGQIYAQLPAASDIDVLENGQFVKYDYRNGVVNFTGAGEWMLVFNEIKLYEPRQNDDDFAMIKDNYVGVIYDAAGNAMPTDTVMVPRVLKTNVGDIFTTNTIKAAAGSLVVGDLLEVGTDGYLAEVSAATGAGTITFQVVKVYTLADGQAAVKIMRIA